jgi:Glycosyl transferase family 2
MRRRKDTEIAALRAATDELREEIVRLREEQRRNDEAQRQLTEALAGQLADARRRLVDTLQVVVDDEAATRRALRAARTTETYAAAFAEPEPLVSIVIPTYENVEGLRTRSIPSALAQTYANVEVVVVGDAAPDATAEVLAGFGDPRVRYENLERRGPYPEEREALWHVAGIPPLNRGFELSRGSWLAVLNDDDAYRPQMVETLLALAREQRVEVAYGTLAFHEPGKEPWALGAFPPTWHRFGWQMAIQHGALRLYEYELAAHLFDEPGDWNRVRRMMRTGVRFAMTDEIVGDYWPSRLWNPDA